MLRSAMNPVTFYNTNDHNDRATFEDALLKGMAANYGLYTIPRDEIPLISPGIITDMKGMSYAEIAFIVLSRYLASEIPSNVLKAILDEAYRADKMQTYVQHIIGKTYIMWLTQGPTYSFKDYAARFFGRMLNHFLGKKGLKRVVVVATSGDTGGAVADALYGLERIDNIVFYPKDSISDGQRRQMTTLGDNIYAFQVNGDFDVCQALAKSILGDKDLAREIFGDSQRFTSANSISLGRLLPQAVYPFFAYSRILHEGEGFIASIPSGNFGDMMGTVVAKQMGLPVRKIICGLNENTEFSDFLESGRYMVKPSIKSPSSAMIVSHPSNLVRLIDFYGGHMYDERDPETGQVTRPGIIDRMPDMDQMRKDIFSIGITNSQHYETMKDVYNGYHVVLDPHGAVGWRTLEIFLQGRHDKPSVIYETADPGKFPDDVKEAIGIIPEPPSGMKIQAELKERVYSIESMPVSTPQGMGLSDRQIDEAKQKIREIFKKK